jgi:hypothetical protein
MEKVIYALWARDGEGRAELNWRLSDEAAPQLLSLANVRGLRLNLRDETVAPAEPLRQTGTEPQMDAVVQLWLDSSRDEFRGPVDSILQAAAGRIAAWLVVESTIIRNSDHPPVAGSRTEGWSQFVFLKQPERLTYDEWLHNWQKLHTPVAIETQANFEYIQNPVVRTLIEGPHPYVAMVEECFPAKAMTDQAVFFDAVGDAAKFEKNTRAMAESCARFIDFEAGVDVLPTSQFQLRWPN